MFAWPVLFPAFSNREDFLVTVSLFDDDTGEALELSGRTLAAPGDFTSAAWTVSSGATTTVSATQLTIPDFPIQNELLAVALVVDQNLGILAGDPVLIEDTATGLNTMSGYVTSYVPASGAMVCQIGLSFEFEIRGSYHQDDGYSSTWSIGSVGDEQPLISAQLGNGISIVDTGKVQVRIPAATQAKLHHRTYKASMNMTDSYDTRQLFIGKLPILSGGVATAQAQKALVNPFGLP